ncbi:MAG: hypothetical protein AB7E05_07210 [Sphingobium sp.]
MDRNYEERRAEELREERIVERRRGGGGRGLLLVLLLIVAIVAVLFATGFWSADLKKGALPDVDVSVQGGELPKVDIDSKKVVVGTKKETIDVPTVDVREGEGQ